jgi:AhpC/TSA family
VQCARDFSPVVSHCGPAMVLKKSNLRDFPLGTTAPDFELLEPLTGNVVKFSDVKAHGKYGTLVCFLSVHCPYVISQRATLKSLGGDLAAVGVGMVAISSNDATSFPADGPTGMASLAGRGGPFSTFPFLYDESQEVAKSYFAVCTPDFFLFNADDKLYYRYVCLHLDRLSSAWCMRTRI